MQRKTRYMPRGLLTELLSDKKTYMGFGKVKTIEIAKDGRSYQANVDLMEGNDRGLVFVGFSPSLFGHIKVDDILLCVFVGGNIDSGVAVALLPSEVRKLHPKVTEEATVITSLEGKKIHLTNNHTAVLDNPAVLGKELRLWHVDSIDNLNLVLDKINTLKDDLNALKGKFNGLVNAYKAHVHPTSSPGAPTTPPTNASQAQSGSDSQVDTTDEKEKFNELKGEDEDMKETNTLRWQSNLVFIQEKDKQKEDEEETNEGA